MKTEPVAELVLEQMAVGDASSLRVKWLTDSYPPVGTQLYTRPVKELHLSLQKSQDGELLAVTYTDDEHRIVEVLWEKPPAKELTLTYEEILKLADETCLTAWIAINPIMDIEKQKEIAKQKMIDFAEAILRKANEK